MPDFSVDASVGRITGDVVTPGDVGPVTTPGLDVTYLSYRDAAQGFAGPQLSVHVVKDLDLNDSTTFGYGDEQAEAVTVGDRPGKLTVLGTVVLLGIPPASAGPEGYLIVAYQMSEPQVLAAAEELLRAGGRPDTIGGLALAAAGADSAIGAGGRVITIAAAVELTLTVHAGDEGTFEGVVRDRVAGASFVKLATAAGAPAVLVADATGGSRTIVWRPTPSTVAELHGAATEAQITAVAAALHLA